MRLYLDIDGVLTCDPDEFDYVETHEIGNALLDWNIDLVREVLAAYDEVIWATSWILPTSSLDEVEKLLGISKSFERINLTWDNYRRSGRSCGKLAAVREHYEANPAHFMWLDDHLGLDDYAWVQQVGARCWRPDYATGGMYEDLDLAKALP